MNIYGTNPDFEVWCDECDNDIPADIVVDVNDHLLLLCGEHFAELAAWAARYLED